MKQTTDFDAAFCGRVPLHQTNQIQPHGLLLVVQREGWKVIQASENVMQVFGKEARDLVNRPISEIFKQEDILRLEQRLHTRLQGKLPFTFSLPEGNYLASILQKEEYLIMELETKKSQPSESDSFIRIYQELQYVMAAIDATSSTEETCSLVLQELKRLSGFDKIMIYRFDENWNGDVIAEIKEPEMDTYLGLKFPASDIPKQARDLYKRSPYRLIPNTKYEPVKLYPVINPVTGAFTDLSESNLRSVAGVHLEYLENMEVQASMSTRILVQGKLWGLISCHHRTPRYLSYELCSVFELLSTIISSKIHAVQNNDLHAFREEMNLLHTGIVEDVYRAEDLMQGLAINPAGLLRLLTADGVALVLNNRMETFGTVPSRPEIEDLIYWLQASSVNRLFQEPGLSQVFEAAGSYAEQASGLLALPVKPDKGNYLLAFRAEKLQTVSWGGNPNEAIRFEPDGKKYHPRNSFRQWQQTMRKTAIPWSPQELDTAEQLRNFMVDYSLNKAIS